MFQLVIVFDVGSATAGVFTTLELAQQAAKDHTPVENQMCGGICWTPYYVAPGDPIHAWEGHIYRFKPCDSCKEVICWSIAPVKLDEYWLK